MLTMSIEYIEGVDDHCITCRRRGRKQLVVDGTLKLEGHC